MLEASFKKPEAKVEAKIEQKPEAKVEPKPEEKKIEAKPEDKKEAKVEPKPEDKKEPGEHFASNKEMRNELDRRKQVIAAKDGEVAKLTTELTTLRARVEELSKNGGVDSKAIAEELAAERKRTSDLQAKLSEYDFRNDPQYEQQFVQKWNRASQRAIAVVNKLRIVDANGDPTDQTATISHLERLIPMDHVAALDQAEVWFGKRAPLVMQHVNELKALQEEEAAAVANHRATYTEKQQQTKAKQEQEKQFAQEAYERITTDLMDARPDLFKPAEGDAEHAEVIQQASDAIDRSLANRANLPIDKRVKLDAMIRTHAISNMVNDKLRARAEAKLKTSEERIAELEKTIIELRGSGPGPAKDLGGEGKGEAEVIGGDDEQLRKAFSK